MKQSKLFKQNTPLIIGFCIQAILFMVLLVLFNAEIGWPNNWRVTSLLSFSEGLLFASPMLWAVGRWRSIVPIGLCLATLFLLVNGVYYRFAADTIPFSMFLSTSSYNNFVFSSGLSLLHWSDLIYLFIPVISICSYCLFHITDLPTFNCSFRVIIGIGILGFYLLSQCLLTISTQRFVRKTIGSNNTFKEQLKAKAARQATTSGYWTSNGLLLYTIINLRTLTGGSIALSSEDYNNIKLYIDKRNGYVPSDTVLSDNCHKNLIFIIVESLNTPYIGYKDSHGKSVTPTLDSLLDASGTVANLNVISMDKDGRSSDGQLMYNTGILPIKHSATALLFGHQDYPSLVKCINPSEATEVIIESFRTWNHGVTTKSYGYDNLICNLDVNERSQDKAVFDKAIELIPNLSRPFILEITTLSMHFPFKDPNRIRIDCEARSEREEDYLRSLATFDMELGYFIKELKDLDILDNSVLVIASDHDQAIVSLDRSDATHNMRNPIAFIACNTGVTRRFEQPAYQHDVFPTVLDIMGCDSEWRGLGRSMFAPDTCRNIEQEAEISDLIIRGNYFATKPQ